MRNGKMTSYKNMPEDLKRIVDANRNTVFELFKHRCLLNPAHKAVVIHEIEPKSLRPSDWWELDNLAPLCANCHETVTNSGSRHREELKRLRNAV